MKDAHPHPVQTPTARQQSWTGQRVGRATATVIAYFDACALIPLLIEEPTSKTAAVVWDTADRVASARGVYTEARAALALAHRTAI